MFTMMLARPAVVICGDPDAPSDAEEDGEAASAALSGVGADGLCSHAAMMAKAPAKTTTTGRVRITISAPPCTRARQGKPLATKNL
jgi:hypothetical protein